MRKNDFDFELIDKVCKDSEIQVKELHKHNIEEIEISKLVNNPYQPRLNIEVTELNNLMKSIVKHGQLEPIAVAKIDNKYMIIFGHRRVEAFRQLNKPTILALIKKNVGQDQLAFSSYEENAQRVNLQPIEHALFLQKILDKKLVKNQEELSKKIGKSPSQLSRILSVLKLPPKLLKKIQEEKYKDIRVLADLNKLEPDITEEIFEKIKNSPRKEALKIIKDQLTGISINKNNIRTYQEKIVINLKNVEEEKTKKIKEKVEEIREILNE